MFSALLCVITLMPMIPYQMKESLPDLFDVFSHLASWSSQNQNRAPDDLLVHLQFGFYDFFHRLYGMFPCNFISFLQHEYSGNKDKSAIFTHTIKPLLETVKMHPMLVTENRETETNTKRWRTMEPHDVVVECAKLTLDSLGKVSTECSHHLPPRPIESSDLILPPEQKTAGFVRGNLYENVWTPSQVILATPPTSATSVPHTPTPGHFSSVPMATPTLPSSQMMTAGGASPPEAAVEATPETTPMKDTVKSIHQLPTNSTVARAFLNLGSSQPSSPMKKDVSPFRFPDPTGDHMTDSPQLVTSAKFVKLVQDRHQPAHHSDVVRTASFESPQTGSIPGSPLPDTLRAPVGQYDSEGQGNDQGSAEDKENLGQNDGTFSQDCEDYDAGAEGSPCSAGGLHIPNSRSMLDFARKFNRWRMHSHCLGDTSQCFSAGTSPAEVAACGMVSGRVMKRSRSWPDVRRSTPPKPPQQNGEGIFVKAEPRQQNIRKPLRELGRMEIVERMDRDTQTIEQWPLAYEHLFINLLSETNKVKQNQENSTESKSPYSMLDRYIELSISKKQAMDARDQVSMYRDQIQLLTLQLQYERHRREVHAERNRRLLGRNRTNLALELQNETLRKQMMQLGQDYSILQTTLNSSRQHFNKREQELHKDCNTWKLKYNKEVEETKQLRQRIESLENRLADEMKQRQEANGMIGSVRGELMDLKNEMQQVEYHADLGSHYRDEYLHMQKELMVMGEIQAKCRDKLSELASLRDRDEEFKQLHRTYEATVAELRAGYEQKSSQLERTKARLAELEANLTGRDEIMTEQKRLLKTVKEEFEERFEVRKFILEVKEHLGI